MNSIFDFVVNDIKEVFQYLHVSVLIGILVFLCIAAVYGLILKKGIPYAGTLLFTVFVIYLAQMLQISFFSREPGSRTQVSLRLLETWTVDAQGRAYVIENILFFVPFAILLAMFLASIKKKPSFLVIPIGLFLSAAIEILQLVTGRGYFQLDDIVANTIGSAIGLFLYGVIVLCIKRCVKR